MVIMRKLLMLIFYLAMLGVGLWTVYGWLTYDGSKSSIVIVAGGFLAGLGAYLLWIDFLSPDRKSLDP